MDVYWIWMMRVVVGVGVLCLAGLIVAGMMTARGREEDMLDEGHDPVPGSPLWFVVKLGLGSILALVLCILMLMGYVWMISDDVDEGVNQLIEEKQRQGR